MQTLLEWLQANLNLPLDFQTRLFNSLLVVLLMWLLRFIAVGYINRRVTSPQLRYRRLKTSAYVAGVAGVFLVGWIWLENIPAVATYLGLLSAGLAIALRDPVTNVMGWVFLLFQSTCRSPYLVQPLTLATSMSG